MDLGRRLRRGILARALAASALVIALLASVGCAAASGPRAAGATTPTVTAVAAVAATATAGPFHCASLTPGPGSLGTFPLPPGTVSSGPNGAAGAGYWIECTPAATEQSITTFFATKLPQLGWRRWNPATDNANGCGTQANDFWQWTKGEGASGSAVGWQFNPPGLPQWNLVFCALAYGR